MYSGLKNVCRTAALPGARKNSATMAASTTIVLAVDTATAPRPLLSRCDLRWGAPLNDFRRSGLTQAEFCRRRDIPLASFRYQFYKARSSKPSPSDNRTSAGAHNQFLPVTILPDPTPSTTNASQSRFELVLSNGRRIAVTPGFDHQTLRRLIAVVEERPCLD